MAKLVAKTYGEALFELAMEEKRGGQFLEEVEAVRRIQNENPDFDRFMLHPGIPREEKLKFLEKVLKGRLSDEMVGFLEIVIRKERYRDLQNIFQYFIDQMKDEEKIGTAYVTTAVELNPAQKERIKARLLKTTSYRTMELHYQVDPQIIGGMVIRIKDRVVDSSIRTKLNDLTKQLLQIQLG